MPVLEALSLTLAGIKIIKPVVSFIRSSHGPSKKEAQADRDEGFKALEDSFKMVETNKEVLTPEESQRLIDDYVIAMESGSHYIDKSYLKNCEGRKEIQNWAADARQVLSRVIRTSAKAQCRQYSDPACESATSSGQGKSQATVSFHQGSGPPIAINNAGSFNSAVNVNISNFYGTEESHGRASPIPTEVQRNITQSPNTHRPENINSSIPSPPSILSESWNQNTSRPSSSSHASSHMSGLSNFSLTSLTNDVINEDMEDPVFDCE